MYLPPTKSQSLEASSSLARVGRVDIERAVVHSASLTLQSRISGTLFDSVELVCSLMLAARVADTVHSTKWF